MTMAACLFCSADFSQMRPAIRLCFFSIPGSLLPQLFLGLNHAAVPSFFEPKRRNKVHDVFSVHHGKDTVKALLFPSPDIRNAC
jgi:hypothetical protein